MFGSAASSSWLVGTVVGHQYGWLRNGSAHAGARKWIPDLRSGWEYRPLVRTPGELTDTWRTDDGTLRIESLRGQIYSLVFGRKKQNKSRLCIQHHGQLFTFLMIRFRP